MGRINLLLATLLMFSAMFLVTSRYQSRQFFVGLERLQSQARELDIGWRSLQLERAELARHARIDRLARQDLKMIPIVPERTLYLNLSPAAANEGGR